MKRRRGGEEERGRETWVRGMLNGIVAGGAGSAANEAKPDGGLGGREHATLREGAPNYEIL